MRYRQLGKTGQQVSEIGMGGHREGVESGSGVTCSARYFLDAEKRAAVVGQAIDAGITYFDTTYSCELMSLAESLRILNRREGLFISGMRVDFFANMVRDNTDPPTYTRREVLRCLNDSGLEHIDQFLLGAMEFDDPLTHPQGTLLDSAMDELRRMKDEGLFRYLGFSTHSPDYAARLLARYPQFDTVMIPYNYANREAEGALTGQLRQSGAGCIAMKTLVWHVYGIPVTALRHLNTVPGRADFDPDADIARMALQWVMQNPLISTVVPAMNSIIAVNENIAASTDAPVSEKDSQHLAQYAALMHAEDFIPLGIAGLLEPNMRVQAYALRLLKSKLGLAPLNIDMAADDAEQAVKRAAESALAHIRAMPVWAPFLA